MNSNSRITSTDEDPSLRIESSAIINLRGVSTKLNKYSTMLYAWLAVCENAVGQPVQFHQQGQVQFYYTV